MSSKCDGKWIKPYRRTDGTRVGSHCRQSIATVLNDNRRKVTQLKKILNVSNASLNNITNKLNMLQQPVSTPALSNQLQSVLKMSIPPSNKSDLRALVDNQLQMLNEQRLHYKKDEALVDAVNAIEAKMKLLYEFMVRIDASMESSALNHAKNSAEDVQALLDEKQRIKLESEANIARIKEIGELNQTLDQRLKALTNEKNALLSQVASIPQIEAENAELKRNIQALKEEGINTQHLSKKLQDQERYLEQLKSVTKEKDELHTQLVALQVAKEDLQHQLEEKQRELQHQSEELDRLRSTSPDALQAKQAELDGVRSQLDALKTESQANKAKLEEELNRKSDEIDALRRQSVLPSVLQSKQAEMDQMRSKLEESSRSALADLQAKLDAKEEELNAMRAQAQSSPQVNQDEWEAKVREQEALVKSKTEENQALQAKLDAMGDVDSLKKQLQEREDQLNATKSIERQLRQSIETLVAEKKEALDRLDVLRKSTVETDAETALNAKISDLEKEMAAVRQEKQALVDEQDRVAQEMASKDARIAELQSQLDASEKKFGELNLRIQQLKKEEKEIISSSVDELQSKKSDLEQSLAKVQQEKESVENRLLEKDREISNLQTELKLRDENLKTLELEKDTRDTSSMSEKEQLMQAIKDKESQNNTLQINLEQTRNEKSKLESQLLAANSERDALVSEKARLQDVDASNQSLREELTKNQALMDALNMEKRQLEQDKADLQSNADSTLDLESKYANEKEMLQQQVLDLSKQHEVDQQNLSELEAFRQKSKEDTNRIMDLTKKLGESSLKEQEYASKLHAIERQLTDVRKEYDLALQAKSAVLVEQEKAVGAKTAVQENVDRLTNEIKARDQTIQDLKERNQLLETQQSDTMTESMKKVEATLVEKEAKLAEMQNLVDTLNLKVKRVDELDRAKKEVDAKLWLSTRDKSKLEAQLGQLSDQLAASQAEVAVLKNQMQELTQTIQKNEALASSVSITEDQAKKNLESKDKTILELTEEKNKMDIKLRELTASSANELNALKIAKEAEIKELNDTIRSRDERIQSLTEASAKQESLAVKNAELEASKSDLQAKYDALVLLQSEKKEVPVVDDANVAQQLVDVKQQLDLVTQQLAQAKDQAVVQDALIQKMTRQLEEKDTSIQQKLKDYASILDEKDKSMDALKSEKEQVEKEYTSLRTSFDESLAMLLKASSILKSKPELSPVADTIVSNVDKLKSNAMKDLIELTLPVVEEEEKTELNPVEEKEYEQDTTSYAYSEAESASYESVYKQYEDILGELYTIQNYYMELLKDVDNKLLTQTNLNLQSDDETTLVVYSFLTTALFHLCKTYIRIPFVLRMISLPDLELSPSENTKIKKNILDALFIEDPLLAVEASNLNQLLRTINESLYETYQKKLESSRSLRIDIMAYYMVKFIYEIKDTNRTTTEYNIFLRMIDKFTQNILKKLRLITYTSIGETKKKLSDLDEIKTKSITKLTSAHNDSNKVVTFVKIRIDGERAAFMNRRFQTDSYLLNKSESKPRKELRLKYSDFDYRKGYGEDTGDVNMGNSDFKTNGFRFYTKNGEPACDLNEIKYNHEFYFGPFSQIYTPDQSAMEITREVTFVNNIERKLRDGKPVCIIGYGASGSGKTSTLVYLSYYKKGDASPTTQNGILAELSNKMTDVFDGCSIQVYEFEGNIEGDEKSAVNDYLMRKYPAPIKSVLMSDSKKTKVDVYAKPFEDDRDKMDPNDTNSTCFEYEVKTIDTIRQWVKKDSKRYNAIPISEEEYGTIDPKSRFIKDEVWYKVVLESYKSDREISEDDYKQLKQGQGYELYGKYFKIVPESEKKMIPMASDIANFMDNKRNIAATANNPVSSRSHVVIFINYKESRTNKQSTLVLCDFAGVENRFDCDSESVLSKLATIPTKKTANNKPEEQVPYYESRISDIKRRNYAKLVENNGPDILAKAGEISPDVRDNIDFVLRNMTQNPLNNIELKKAEIQFQSKYPPSQMVPLDQFMDRLVMIKKLQDRLNQKEIASIRIGSFSIEDWLKKYQKEDYKEIKLLASDPIFKLTKNQYGLTANLIVDLPGKEWLDIKPVAPIDISTEGQNTFVGKLVFLTATYANELFRKYKSDEERAKSLVVMQYFFEMMSSVSAKTVKTTKSDTEYNYTVDKLASSFAKKICMDRVKEGLYINDSLLQLRKFIGTLVKSQSKGYAPFIDKCLPLQCNPFYKDCFGMNEYDGQVTLVDPNMSSLAQQIMKAPNYSDMTFCIMCVINLSTGANNPPPSPYIDITNLMVEFERLKMVKQQFFMNRRILQKNIQEQLEIEFNGALLSNAYKVDATVLDQISNHPLLTTPLSDNFVRMVQSSCSQLKDMTVMDSDYLTVLEKLIDEINKSNAITTIGTLQFTDTMAKFGASTMTCNVLAKSKFGYDTNIVKTVNQAGAKELYASLLLLKTKGVITQDQLMKEYKPFVSLYDPFPKPEVKDVKKKK